MRRADAPSPGWYPDPEGGARLRWWEGTDWTELYRAPPSPSELEIRSLHQGGRSSSAAATAAQGVVSSAQELAAQRRRDTEEVVAQVRQVARNEIERAADIFSARARAATKQIEPLVSEYTNRLIRWLKVLLVVGVVLVIAWFVFQAIAEVTFFDWLGDRIDGLTD